MPKRHELKITPDNFRQLQAGERTLNLRVNDRDFMIGDTIRLVAYQAYDEPRSTPGGMLAIGFYAGPGAPAGEHQ